ncbi:MAG: NUDIX hydrolase [Parachlamydiales bacterium]|nr:NUDIX hydrolase [Parachlamydiales bacterium]
MLDKSVATTIFSHDRTKILLIKRRDVPVWVLPGGGIEKNESPEEAILREIQEETGYTSPTLIRKVGEYAPINRLARYTYLFECSVPPEEHTLENEEVKEIKFFPLNSLPHYLPPPYKEWIDDGKKNIPTVIYKRLHQINYLAFFKNCLCHPVLIIRFLLARLGFPINT